MRVDCRDLFFFAVVLCADAWSDKYHDFGEIQQSMCAFLQDRAYRRKFLSAFRLSFKTTVLVAFFCWLFCWYLATKKPISIIYNTLTKENAWNFSAEVKHTLLESPYMQWVFPELPRLERQYDVMTKNRIQHKHVRLDFASLDTTLVSRHFPIWVNDDIETDTNIQTKTGREELIRRWRYQKAILTKISKLNLGLEIDVGTPYHFDGLIWHIRNLESYKKLIIPYRDKNGKLTFPELYTEEDFKQKKEDMGAYIFAAQYQLTPISEEDAMVKESWIKYWEKGKLPKNVFRSMVIDPGGADPKVHDATGITICDTDEFGNLYVIYAEESWTTPNGLMEDIIGLRERYKPDDVRIEKDKYGVTIADIYEHRYPLMNISFVQHKGRKKPVRIWRLRGWFEKSRVFIGRDQKALKNQLLQYQGEDSIRYDDLLDSLSYQLDIRRVPDAITARRLPLSGREFEPAVPKSFREEFREFMDKQELNEESRYYDKAY